MELEQKQAYRPMEQNKESGNITVPIQSTNLWQGAKNTMNFDICIRNSISFLASDFVKAGIRQYLQPEWGLSSCD